VAHVDHTQVSYETIQGDVNHANVATLLLRDGPSDIAADCGLVPTPLEGMPEPLQYPCAIHR